VPGVRLAGYDIDGGRVSAALQRGVIDDAARSIAELADSTVLVLAVPPGAMRATLFDCPREPVVTDVCSTKVRVMEWAAEAGVDLVGGHPLCGREASGPEAADATIFEDAPWVLTRPSAEVEELVRAVGARPVFMEPEQHDRVVAAVSHAAFVLSAAYMLAVASDPEWEIAAGLAASGFRDMTRLAAGSTEMYAGILETNAANIASSLWLVEQELAKIRRHLEHGDTRVAELLEEARAARERWEKNAGAQVRRPPPDAPRSAGR
jgi:prephenate dehydrogenase